MNLSTLLATCAALLVLNGCSDKPTGEEAGDAGAGNEAGAGSPSTGGDGGSIGAGDGGTGEGGSAGAAAGQGGNAGTGNGGTGQGGSAGAAAGQGGNAGAGNGGMGQGGSAGAAAGQGGNAGAGNGGSSGSGGTAGLGGAGGCVTGQSTCAEDGYGFRVCGSDHAWGGRVPCAPNFQCDTTSGSCRRPSAPNCLNTEVMLLVDRSSSIADVGASPWIRGAMSTVLPFVHHGNRIGLRQFPSGAGCAVGPASAMTTNNYAAIGATLSDAASDGSTPIAGALSGLLPLFGDPNDAQAAILVTQGDENCDTQAGVIAATQALWQGGVRVYVVAVTTTADRSFLDRVAAAGGTGTSRLVTNLATFESALESIFTELSACECDEACQCGDGIFNPSIEQCDDGNLADSDGCTSTCTSRGKVVFRTSATFKGNFGGLASGDATCQRLADAVPLTGTFKAWLSDPAVATAAQRLSHSDEPYVMTGSDRPLLAGNWADLTDGTLASSINRDEHGVSSSGFAVWTGTWATGSSTCSDCVCDGWTSENSTGAVGGDTAGTGWTFVYRNLPCSSAYGLYCFEQ